MGAAVEEEHLQAGVVEEAAEGERLQAEVEEVEAGERHHLQAAGAEAAAGEGHHWEQDGLAAAAGLEVQPKGAKGAQEVLEVLEVLQAQKVEGEQEVQLKGARVQLAGEVVRQRDAMEVRAAGLVLRAHERAAQEVGTEVLLAAALHE